MRACLATSKPGSALTGTDSASRGNSLVAAATAGSSNRASRSKSVLIDRLRTSGVTAPNRTRCHIVKRCLAYRYAMTALYRVPPPCFLLYRVYNSNQRTMADEPNTRPVSTRLTPEEREVVTEAAEEAGVTVSTLVREGALRRASEVRSAAIVFAVTVRPAAARRLRAAASIEGVEVEAFLRQAAARTKLGAEATTDAVESGVGLEEA